MVEGLCRGELGGQSPGCKCCSSNPSAGLAEQLLLAGGFCSIFCCLCCWEMLTAALALPLSPVHMPPVFQIPQVLVELKNYPHGDKVRHTGCGLELFAAPCVQVDCACCDGAGARAVQGWLGWEAVCVLTAFLYWGGGEGGMGGFVSVLLQAEHSPLCVAGFHRGCELCLRVPAEADPSA